MNNGLMAFYYNDMSNLCWTRNGYEYSDFYKSESKAMVYISEPTCKSLKKRLRSLVSSYLIVNN